MTNIFVDPGKPIFSHFWKVLVLIIGLTLLIKLPTLNFQHVEGDEVAFWHLANNWIKTGKYTDKGDDLTPYPAYVDRFTRDMPVHPPLFTALLVPFAKYQAIGAAVIASWIGHLLTIFAVALVGRHVLKNVPDADSALSPMFWLPLLGVATDPVMTWISGILWIDNLDAGFATLAIALSLIAKDSKKQELMWTLAGIAMGLGLLSKVTMAVIVPLIGYLIYQIPETRARVVAALCFSAPALMLSLPWYIPLYFTMHEFIFPKPHLPPGIFQPLPCPFCDLTATRPKYYFFLKISLITPLILVGIGYLVIAIKKKTSDFTEKLWRELLFPFAWFLLVVVVATLAGSFIMRRVSIAVPAIYVATFYLSAHFQSNPNLKKYQSTLLFSAGVAIIYGAIGGAYYLSHGSYGEFFSQFELAGLINLWGAR